MKIGLDTCSLVSLELAGLLDLVAGHFDLAVTPRIVAETRRMAAKSDELAKAAKKALTHLGQTIPVIENVPSNPIGEEELKSLYQDNTIQMIITDDMKAAAKFVKQGVKVRLTVFLLQVLIAKGLLSSQEAKKALDRVCFHRRWDPNKSRLYLLSKQLLD